MKHKILITGPESCGKSYTTTRLAEYFNDSMVVEQARGYFESATYDYDQSLIFELIELQFKAEELAFQNADRFLFCDTGPLNFKIWLEYDGFQVPPSLLTFISSKPYSLVLLMKPDIPWVPDPLRKYPDKRDQFFKMFEQELIEAGYEYIVIDGQNEDRIQNAINAIRSHFGKFG